MTDTAEKQVSIPEYHIVIPARFASERLPGKPLAEIRGEPLIVHVARKADASGCASATVATDDDRIYDTCELRGIKVIMTSRDHATGTDRITECAEKAGWGDDTLVVNLQGDEPLMPPECLDQVANLLANSPAAAATSLYHDIDSPDEVGRTSVVKVVTDSDGYALYFSRQPIPYVRGSRDIASAMAGGVVWKRHIGLYGFRVGTLREFSASNPSALEQAERLEQLRILEGGGRIRLEKASTLIPAGVDTPMDLERVREYMTNKH